MHLILFFSNSALEEDGGTNIAIYNHELEVLNHSGLQTWFQMPWLFAECYMQGKILTQSMRG